MLRVFTLVVPVLLLLVAIARPAAAVPQFQKVFFAEYLEDNSDAEYVEFVKKDVKCFLCHQGKKKKKNRNSYGLALSELLDHKKDKKDVEKITAALKEVADMPSDPSDDDSQTFSERIAESLLPGGELDDLKVEPADAGN